MRGSAGTVADSPAPSDARPAVAVPRDRVLSAIQVLRALAAWSIVGQHYCLIFPVEHPSWWRQGFLIHGSVGVDVFFIISGFVMALGAMDPATTPRSFIAKRLGRLVPAYWLYTLVIAAVITYAPQVLPNQGCSPEFLVKSLLFVPAQNPSGLGLYPVNTVGWTLNLEVLFYVLVALSLFTALPRRWLWILAGLAVVQMLLSPLGIVTAFYSTPLIYEFAMGLVLAHLWKAGVLRGPAWQFAGLAVLGVVLLLRAPTLDNTRVIDCGVPAFLLVAGCIGCERYFQRLRVLERMGDHSYSVYLIHPLILFVGWYAYRETHIKHVFPFVCIGLIAVLGAASYHFVERPVGRWLTRLLSARSP